MLLSVILVDNNAANLILDRQDVVFIVKDLFVNHVKQAVQDDDWTMPCLVAKLISCIVESDNGFIAERQEHVFSLFEDFICLGSKRKTRNIDADILAAVLFIDQSKVSARRKELDEKYSNQEVPDNMSIGSGSSSIGTNDMVTPPILLYFNF